jgi:hypothetical protein
VLLFFCIDRREEQEESRGHIHQDIESKERVAAMISSYQMQMRQSEVNLAQLQQKYISQQLQLKQLLTQKPLLKSDGSDQVEQEKKTESAAQYENLISEIKELRRQIFSKEAVVSRKPSAQLMQVLRDVVNSAPPTPHDRSMSKIDVQPVPVVKKDDRTQDSMRSDLVAAETRVVQATTRQAALEEELQSYQSYMKEVVPKYQRQIQSLQQELQKYKAAHTQQVRAKQASAALESKPSASTNKSDDVKFPPINPSSSK